eukprot:361266-Chlamydomonas_euryale.AAC.1
MGGAPGMRDIAGAGLTGGAPRHAMARTCAWLMGGASGMGDVARPRRALRTLCAPAPDTTCRAGSAASMSLPSEEMRSRCGCASVHWRCC